MVLPVPVSFPKFEDIGTKAIVDSLFTIIDRFIDLATERSHSEGIVVSADVITKGLADVILSSEQVKKLRWHCMEMWQGYLSTEAAHAEPGVGQRGYGQMFSHPMKCMAVGTLNIHPSQIMDRPIRTKRTTGRRQNQLRCCWCWIRIRCRWWKVFFFLYDKLRTWVRRNRRIKYRLIYILLVNATVRKRKTKLTGGGGASSMGTGGAAMGGGAMGGSKTGGG